MHVIWVETEHSRMRLAASSRPEVKTLFSQDVYMCFRQAVKNNTSTPALGAMIACCIHPWFPFSQPYNVASFLLSSPRSSLSLSPLPLLWRSVKECE